MAEGKERDPAAMQSRRPRQTGMNPESALRVGPKLTILSGFPRRLVIFCQALARGQLARGRRALYAYRVSGRQSAQRRFGIRRFRVQLAAVAMGAALGLACSVNAPDYTADADMGSTHGFVVIERSATLVPSTEAIPTGEPSAWPQSARATALAGFVRVPVTVDAEAVFGLVGFGNEVPEAGQCTEQLNQTARPPLTPMADVEFLDAGELRLATKDRNTSLAPHAFPTVTDSISGVVYASRDQDPEQLPGAQDYILSATGGLSLSALQIRARAPEPLGAVTVNGIHMDANQEGPLKLQRNLPIDLTWKVPGDSPAAAAQDLVYAILSDHQTSRTMTCSFVAGDGAASLATEAFASTESAVLSLHRLRRQEFLSKDVDRGEVRFDFELVIGVEFSS